jgi:hypothetical protein
MPDEWEWLVDELSLSEDYFSGGYGNASTRGAGASKESQSLCAACASSGRLSREIAQRYRDRATAA